MRGKTNVGGGTNTNAATATAADLLQGKTAFAKGNLLTGIIPTKAAETITPGVANKTIAAGLYLSGTQTIAGDVNLLAANIAAGKNIFGVNGSFNGTIKTASGTQSVTKSYGVDEIILTVTGLAFYPLSMHAGGTVRSAGGSWQIGLATAPQYGTNPAPTGYSYGASVGSDFVSASVTKVGASYTVVLRSDVAAADMGTHNMNWYALGI